MSEAAFLGNIAIIEKLLKAGADPDSPSADGQTALMMVARTDQRRRREAACWTMARTWTRVRSRKSRPR